MDTLYILKISRHSIYTIGTTSDLAGLIYEYKTKFSFELEIFHKQASARAHILEQILSNEYSRYRLGQNWFYLLDIAPDSLLEKLRFLDSLEGQILMESLHTQSLLSFFSQRPALSVRKIEEQAGIPAKTLWFVLKQTPGRKLTPLQKIQLLPVLKKYGFSL